MDKEILRKMIINDLKEKGFILEFAIETSDWGMTTIAHAWARPKHLPTCRDPYDWKEAQLQEEYAINGITQDFSEPFDYEVKEVNGKIQIVEI